MALRRRRIGRQDAESGEGFIAKDAMENITSLRSE